MRCPDTCVGKYVFNQKIISELGDLLFDLKFPPSPLHAVFMSIRMDAMYGFKKEEDELKKREACFEYYSEKDLDEMVMGYIGLAQNTKSARNT